MEKSPVLLSRDITSPIMVSVAMRGYQQHNSAQASIGKVHVLCDTNRDRITNQQIFDFVNFLTTNRFPGCWHWLAVIARAPGQIT